MMGIEKKAKASRRAMAIEKVEKKSKTRWTSGGREGDGELGNGHHVDGVGLCAGEDTGIERSGCGASMFPHLPDKGGAVTSYCYRTSGQTWLFFSSPWRVSRRWQAS